MTTSTETSMTILIVTGLLKFLEWVTDSKIIAVLTIISLLLAIIFHAFGVYERWQSFKRRKKITTKTE